jgi:hypothetical protein
MRSSDLVPSSASKARLFNGVVGLQDRSLKLTGCQLAKEGGTCGSDKLTVALLSSTNRAIRRPIQMPTMV